MPARRVIDHRRIGTFHDVYAGPQPEFGVLKDTTKTKVWSEGHYGYQNPPGASNVGGAFGLTETTYEPAQFATSEIYGTGPWHNDHYSGMMLGHCQMPGAIPFQDGSHRAAEAYAKMKPTEPVFSAMNSVFELRDLPGLLKHKFEETGLRGMSNAHVAMQFGLLPTLMDAVNLVLAQKQAQEKMAQLLRDNGRPVRRRINLADTSEEVSSFSGEDWGWIQPGLNTYFWRAPPTATWKLVKSDKIWASARFRYWLPEGPRDIKYKRKLLQALYGVQYPSPAQLYNMVPWSWLIDWFSNLGYVIENLDNGVADRLAADYFYVMRTEELRVTKTHNIHLYAGVDHKPASYQATSTAFRVNKTRLRGDPFGFATNQEDLNATQVSILGALGLSRLY